MKIAVIGAGAMGSLFGGYLSAQNEVYLIDTDAAKVDVVNRNGLKIHEDGVEKVFYPTACVDTQALGHMDLIILFVKALFSNSALKANSHLIGPHTYVLTLQNGSGHEDILREFVTEDRIIIGTTQHNSHVVEPGVISHGGGGTTSIGPLCGSCGNLQPIADALNTSGFVTDISDNIQKIIWKKLFVNVSVSVLTGVLQVKMGFLLDNASGWQMVERLLKEAVAVANGDGLGFDEAQVIADVRTLVDNAREGLTSIYADLRDGRRTEVDTISGSVVRASRRNGVQAPCHEFIVQMVHAMEGRNA
ncbi:MAG: 2-dehydropantoate 2-reductase [Oscillospiraceae bacterium]|nr:2-dehydropantoate 2-reductase [Oscillospiraceae bacterium]